MAPEIISGHPWRIKSRGELALVIAIFLYCAPIFAYNIAIIPLRYFAYAATKDLPAVRLFGLNIPCDENHWIGFRGTYGDGEDGRVHGAVCLTAAGWVVIPGEHD